MLNFHRAEALLFPSVPPQLATTVAAATQTPVLSQLGEGSGRTGQTPAAEAPTEPSPSQPGSALLAAAGPAVVTSPVAGGGNRPGDGASSSTASAFVPFSGPPACERGQSSPVHPMLRYRLEDRHLALLLDQWKATP